MIGLPTRQPQVISFEPGSVFRVRTGRLFRHETVRVIAVETGRFEDRYRESVYSVTLLGVSA